ncbi:MAG: hypothetical protein CEN89_646 [Candidatus Berkelbacteria bacterium Licking1014_7]|uniref:DUF559 domain-containing protein n=1 Tax=Candidatus Berkelbacteria bacterium Licking1014_7 TaxID=2017147 RepID=A0A554LIN9_9BACT|nr:MAG: hypothetical protein CEN89_646 [Candidatus Berkelbacteria bacterium Licking1014_7]
MKRSNIERCRKLRENQTDAERKLWQVLRSRQLSGVKFRRQFPIGRYILDFYSPKHRLGIEADGGQHYENKGKSEDGLRTRELAMYGVKIVRFSDLDILNNIDGVYEAIQGVIENKDSGSPSPCPSPHRGEGVNYRGQNSPPPHIKGAKNRPFWGNHGKSPTRKWQEVENGCCFKFSDGKIVS